MAKRVIVCGAGLAGLNAARNLLSFGFEVILLEKSDRPGGRIATELVDGFKLDRGFQVVNPSYSELRRTGVAKKLDLIEIPKGVDIRIASQTFRVGDFRSNLGYLRDDFSSSTGKLSEKLKFLAYLLRRPEELSFGEAAASFEGFFERTLKPFLDGVFLTDSRQISNRVARELIGWFIKGNPALINGGIGKLAETLSEGLAIEYGAEVISVSEKEVVTNIGKFDADAIVVATDPVGAATLLGQPVPEMNSCTTWYFKIKPDEIRSNHLRVGGIGPVANSLVLSNLLDDCAPEGAGLLQATTLEDCAEGEVRDHLSYLWDRDAADWELIARYEIAGALPRHGASQGLVASAKLGNGVFVAGDWRNIPAQQGALLSGRLAARAVNALLSER